MCTSRRAGCDNDIGTWTCVGYSNILEWSLDKERLEGNESQRQEGDGGEDEAEGGTSAASMDLFRTRDSAGYATPKSRPLYAKLELLLDLIFRRLFWDPAQPEVPFSYDGLLKVLKKLDKDLGP